MSWTLCTLGCWLGGYQLGERALELLPQWHWAESLFSMVGSCSLLLTWNRASEESQRSLPFCRPFSSWWSHAEASAHWDHRALLSPNGSSCSEGGGDQDTAPSIQINALYRCLRRVLLLLPSFAFNYPPCWAYRQCWVEGLLLVSDHAEVVRTVLWRLFFLKFCRYSHCVRSPLHSHQPVVNTLTILYFHSRSS